MSDSITMEPQNGFTRFALNPKVMRGVTAAGFEEPRPIQTETIPAVLEGRDVLGLAPTGTGKTAAFALPILERILARRRAGPRALILAPTRELAIQIDAEIRGYARFTSIKTAMIFGGVSQNAQVRALRAQPEIIVACPGRLLDLLEQGFVMLGAIETLVLDEADQMFDMGFLPSIRQILKMLPAERQNLMFSATMPKEIRSLADRILRNPFVVDADHKKPIAAIEHAIFTVASHNKFELLKHVIKEDGFRSAIVFSRTKHRAKRLAEQLSRTGCDAVGLQGNMTQAQRDRAMSGFRSGRFNVLVATDIAARGIDVANVSHVINFDIPDTPDAYTHRIGRTGRSERSGIAYTFVSESDWGALRDIERKLKAPIRKMSSPSFSDAPTEAPRRNDSPRPSAGRNARGQNGAGPGDRSRRPGARRAS